MMTDELKQDILDLNEFLILLSEKHNLKISTAMTLADGSPFIMIDPKCTSNEILQYIMTFSNHRHVILETNHLIDNNIAFVVLYHGDDSRLQRGVRYMVREVVVKSDSKIYYKFNGLDAEFNSEDFERCESETNTLKN